MTNPCFPDTPEEPAPTVTPERRSSSRAAALPVKLPGATEFSATPELASELWAVEQLKERPDWLEPLRAATSFKSHFGRDRIEGDWALAFLCFVASRHVDIEPWWAASRPDIWEACGFTARPSYQTTWNRFVEMEKKPEAYADLVTKLVRIAGDATNGLVGRDIHVDGTEAETNARLIHDCKPGDVCARQKGKRRGHALYPVRIHANDERGARHAAAAQAPPENIDLGDIEDAEVDEDGSIMRIKMKGGCWYRQRDKTAGVRAYAKANGGIKRFWVGFNCNKAIDHYLGAPIAIRVISSSTQEYDDYSHLLDQVISTTGVTPRAVISDRGNSVAKVFEWNTRREIATVVPFRKSNGHDHRRKHQTDDYDRHGVPRCKSCGGPTTPYGFEGGDSPRLWFKCDAPVTPECEKTKSIACSHDWRTLVPLWRTTEAYWALRKSGDEYERVHNLFRQRYRVAGDTHAIRPKRIGAPWQQLRANAALVLEWLRILCRQGWLDGHILNERSPVVQRNDEGLRRFMKSRNKLGLHRPYGAKAKALGLIPKPDPPPGSDDRPF
jgi:hypothetical protein